jgi:RecQ family ATP-dependent DNA helicase
MNNYQIALKKYYGFDTLKPFQEAIFKHLDKDLLILSPTGSGKSLCYQLPAIIDDGITVIISPLKSLIEDQLFQLEKRNVNVDFINGDINKKDLALLYKKLKGITEYHLLYVTPEIITTDSKLIILLKELNKNNKFSRLVIDEAHCVSTWGHDFRSSYLNLETIKKMFIGVKVMALTATATPKVKEDIIKILDLKDPHIETSSFFRPNLNLKVINRNDSELSCLRDLVQKKYMNMCGIIYCHSQRETERVAMYLDNFITTRHYHAGLNQNIRKLYQKQWLNGQVKIIVATIAFGMGIDKPDVRFVIHYNLPSSLEGYYQEIGRAGRDGLPSDCILYYSYQDKVFYDKLIRLNNGKNLNSSNYNVNLSNIQQVQFINTEDDDKEGDDKKQKQSQYTKDSDYVNYQSNKLNQMINFIENVIDCRHYQLSNYFGEKLEEKANWCNSACDNCIRHKDQTNIQEKDLTQHAIKIIEIVQKLRIDTKDIITRNKINLIYQKQISPFFPATELTIERLLGRMIGLNIIKEILVRNNSGLWFEDIHLTDNSSFSSSLTIKMLVPNSKNTLTDMIVVDEDEQNTETSPNTERKSKSSKIPKGFNFEEDFGKKAFNQELMDDSLQEKYNLTHLPLYNQLIQYRSEEAKRQKIAPYRIFNNQTLEEIVKVKPINDSMLKNIHGIGDAKIREYGRDIIKMVNVHK